MVDRSRCARMQSEKSRPIRPARNKATWRMFPQSDGKKCISNEE
jgi:hypothetical protein